MSEMRAKDRFNYSSNNYVLLAGIIGGAIVIVGIAITLIFEETEKESTFELDLQEHNCQLDSHDFGNGCRPERTC